MTYNLETVRKLLNDAFDSVGIHNLAFALFPTVNDDFTLGMGKGQMILAVVDSAERHGRIADLLDYVKEKNAYQYNLYALQLETKNLKGSRKDIILTDITWTQRNKKATEYFIELSQNWVDNEDLFLRALKSWQLCNLSTTGWCFSVEGALLFGPTEQLPVGYYTDVHIEDRRGSTVQLRN